MIFAIFLLDSIYFQGVDDKNSQTPPQETTDIKRPLAHLTLLLPSYFWIQIQEVEGVLQHLAATWWLEGWRCSKIWIHPNKPNLATTGYDLLLIVYLEIAYVVKMPPRFFQVFWSPVAECLVFHLMIQFRLGGKGRRMIHLAKAWELGMMLCDDSLGF